MKYLVVWTDFFYDIREAKKVDNQINVGSCTKKIIAIYSLQQV